MSATQNRRPETQVCSSRCWPSRTASSQATRPLRTPARRVSQPKSALVFSVTHADYCPVDFAGWKVKATRTAIPWPATPAGVPRRASVNSFGYGGSNVHVVLEQATLPQGPRHVSSYLSDDAEFDFDDEEDESEARPHTLLVSANDEASLKANIRALANHLINPRVKVKLEDLAYTLSERRSGFFHRAYLTTTSTDIDENAFVLGKKASEAPRIGFVFTGQGAQWPQMGRDLLRHFPAITRGVLEELDAVLQKVPDAPAWSLLDELTQPRTAEHLRQPEFSQPLVTALQLCIIAVLQTWGVSPQSVVGHSSGEIAAAYAAGLLSRSEAILAAFYRGRAALNRQADVEGKVGMLAVGVGVEALSPYLEKYAGSAWIACYNSPSSLTVSGKKPALESLEFELKSAGHFARLLQVDLAYHSELMGPIGEEYETLLEKSGFGSAAAAGHADVTMFSSVTGRKKTDAADGLYWKTNMVSAVRFDEAAREMLSSVGGPNFLIEIGPSGALAGPVAQVKKSLPGGGSDIIYTPAWARGADAGKALFNAAGRLFIAGHAVDFPAVNRYDVPSTIVDLPNYVWNHAIKYWHENAASKDWRFKRYVSHDLLGSKVLGTSWQAPSWRAHLDLANVPWLKDHKMGADILMPGSGYITMALEAIWQKWNATEAGEDGPVKSINDLAYRFRNVRFDKALVLEEGEVTEVQLWLTPQPGSKSWHEFRIASTNGDRLIDHSSGLVRVQDVVEASLPEAEAGELKFPTAGQLWYKAQSEIGYGFGPSFQKLIQVESTCGQRHGRSLVNLEAPESKWTPQTYYPVHPASLDGCFQTVTPSLWSGERGSLNAVVVPSLLDDLVINKVPQTLKKGLSLANSEYTGRGRLSEAKSYLANCTVYDPETGALAVKMSGLRFVELDTGVKADPHTFDQIAWKPDITFLTQDKLSQLPASSPSDRIHHVIDLVAHKQPALRVLEVNLDAADTSSLWFDVSDASSRAAYGEYALASINGRSLVDVQTQHEEKRNTSFLLLNASAQGLDLPKESYDLTILKLGQAEREATSELLDSIAPFLVQTGGYTLLVRGRDIEPALTGSDSGRSSSPQRSSSPSEQPGTPDGVKSPHFDLESSVGGLVSSDVVDVQPKFADLGHETSIVMQPDMLTPDIKRGFGGKLEIAGVNAPLEVLHSETVSAYLYSPFLHENKSSGREVLVARLSKDTPELSPSLKAALTTSGWTVKEQTLPFTDLTPGSTILIPDELTAPVLTSINDEQWTALKTLVGSGNNLLWLTLAAQLDVTNPDTALAPGLFRVIRMEDPNAKLTTLDVQSASGPATDEAILQVLDFLGQSRPQFFAETEFAEKDGVLQVHRVVPDGPVNEFKKAQKEGAEIEVQRLHKDGPTVSLRAERMGTFQGLVWAENGTEEVPVEEGRVEVEVRAAGVNFKVSSRTLTLEYYRAPTDSDNRTLPSPWVSCLRTSTRSAMKRPVLSSVLALA